MGHNPRKQPKVDKDFLQVGTVSWSLLLSSYFLSLHVGYPQEIDEEEAELYSIDYTGVIEMLEVLSNEFGDMVPLETNQETILREGKKVMEQFKDARIIRPIPNQQLAEPLNWRYNLTKEGLDIGKKLSKAVGLVAKLEVDVEDMR